MLVEPQSININQTINNNNNNSNYFNALTLSNFSSKIMTDNITTPLIQSSINKTKQNSSIFDNFTAVKNLKTFLIKFFLNLMLNLKYFFVNFSKFYHLFLSINFFKI